MEGKKQLLRITLDTNPEDCNLHCIMCEEHSPYSEFKQMLFKKEGIKYRRMPIALIESILSQANELKVKEIIPSTMGEPLLYKGIDTIFRLVKQYGMKIDVTTNGTFPIHTIKEWAEMIIPIAKEIRISWNGATSECAEQIMTGLSFNKAIESVSQLVAYRDLYYNKFGEYCNISFQMTFMKTNIRELSDIVKLAAKLGVDIVKGGHIWSHFPETADLSIQNSEEAIKEWNNYIYQAKEAQEKYLKPNGDKVILENLTPIYEDSSSIINTLDYDCPFLGKELWISAIGKISICSAPDEQRQLLGDFGNMATTTLKAVFESDKYQQLCRNYKQIEPCKTCVWRNPPK